MPLPSEAITDTIPGRGWDNDTNGEIGNKCAWETRQVGRVHRQRQWSNKVNSCK